jgi:FAD/FMN-containing dehydrogenase
MKDLLDALINHGFLKDDIKFPKSTDDVHIYNLRLPVLPRVVVEPRTTQLVSAAIKVANQFGLKVQARSGGHSYGNYCLGGADGHMVVDMKHFTEFHMDRSSWRATVGSAVKLRDFCQSLHDNGDRAVPHGVCSPVGIGGECLSPNPPISCSYHTVSGHATSGGMGQLTRKWGYALDAIVEAEIVTADGEICTANAVENADLFWVSLYSSPYGIFTVLFTTKYGRLSVGLLRRSEW